VFDWKANWIGHILCRECLLKYVIEGNLEGTGRLIRIRKQLLDNLMETKSYWNLKRRHWIALADEISLEEAMDLSYGTA
jgi:hypothetical protein